MPVAKPASGQCHLGAHARGATLRCLRPASRGPLKTHQTRAEAAETSLASATKSAKAIATSKAGDTFKAGVPATCVVVGMSCNHIGAACSTGSMPQCRFRSVRCTFRCTFHSHPSLSDKRSPRNPQVCHHACVARVLYPPSNCRPIICEPDPARTQELVH